MSRDTNSLRVASRVAAAKAVQDEREKIASWLECGKNCQYLGNSGNCHRVDDFCARYVAECVRMGAKP